MSDLLDGAWQALSSIPNIGLYLVAAWLLYIPWLVAWVVLQKREPVATLSWVLSLALLPYVGFLVYFLLGPQRINRQRLRRGRTRSGMGQYSTICPADDSAVELARIGPATTGLPASSAVRVARLVDGPGAYGGEMAAGPAVTHYIRSGR